MSVISDFDRQHGTAIEHRRVIVSKAPDHALRELDQWPDRLTADEARLMADMLDRTPLHLERLRAALRQLAALLTPHARATECCGQCGYTLVHHVGCRKDGLKRDTP